MIFNWHNDIYRNSIIQFSRYCIQSAYRDIETAYLMVAWFNKGHRSSIGFYGDAAAGIGIYPHMCKLYAKFNEAERIMLLFEFLFRPYKWMMVWFNICKSFQKSDGKGRPFQHNREAVCSFCPFSSSQLTD